MATCHANGDDHCCHVGELGVCPYLEENTVQGMRWACGLRRKYGSWDAVHASEEYKVVDMVIGPTLRCGDWPPVGMTCATCGVVG